MTISETKQLIISKTISDYEKFDKASISLRDISFSLNSRGETFVSYVLQSSYYDLDNNIINKETNLNSLISNDIKQLLLAISKEQKINKGTLTIYPSGFYESSFIWDEGAHLAYLGGNIYSRKEIFAERLFSSFEEEEFYQDKGYNPNEYTFICVVVEINAQKEVKIHRSVTLSEGRIVEVPLVAPAHWLAAILDFQNQTNDPDLKQYAIKWNKMTFNIPSYEQNFDPDKNVIFEWREDLA